MAHIGVFGGVYRVVVDVDDVIEHAHGGFDSAGEFGFVQFAIGDVLGEVYRAQVTYGNFVPGFGVEGNLGTQVRGVHHACVLLRAAQVAGSLKVIQGWPVSNNMPSILRQRSRARTVLAGLILPSAAKRSYSS